MNRFPEPNSGTWTSDICDCCTNCESCCLGCWCPCVAVGRYVEILDRGDTTCKEAGWSWCCLYVSSLACCGWIYTCGYRKQLRKEFGLPESPSNDCRTECCCAWLSICQIYRELLNRKIDPKKGYEGVKDVFDRSVGHLPSSLPRELREYAPGQQSMNNK